MSSIEVNKKLKLNIGICKRLVKEVESYKKEAESQERKIQKMRDESKDPYDIRKQEEVLQESYMMMPDSQSRLEAAVMELSTILDQIEESEEPDHTMLEEAKSLVAANNI